MRGKYTTLKGSQADQGCRGPPEKADSVVTKTHVWLKGSQSSMRLNPLQQHKKDCEVALKAL